VISGTGILDFVGSHLFELASIGGVIAALLFAATQNRLTARAVRAQSLQQLHSLEVQSNFQKGSGAISRLRKYDDDDYAAFLNETPEDVQQAIVSTVAFLNFIATLGEEGYMNVQDSWNIYFWAYRESFYRLMPWWLKGQRQHQLRVFAAFERTTKAIGAISQEKIEAFDDQIDKQHVETYHAVSHVSKRDLRPLLAERIVPDSHMTSSQKQVTSMGE
jgi:hypothetical protein